MEVEAEHHSRGEPQHRRQRRTRQHAMPRLGARDAVMVDERDDRDAGERCDDPAQGRPQSQDVRPEFVADVVHNPGLDLIAEHQQKGREYHGNAGQHYQQEGDHPFLHQSPDFWHLVGVAEPFHPRDHHAGSGPQGDGCDGNHGPQIDLFGAVEIPLDRRPRPFGKNPTYSMADLASKRSCGARLRKNRGHQKHCGKQGEDGRKSRAFGHTEGVVLEGPPQRQTKMFKKTHHTGKSRLPHILVRRGDCYRRPWCDSSFFGQLLGRKLLGFVLALVAEQFQSAFCFLVRGRHFLLHLRSGLLHLLRQPDVAVVLHAGSRRNETAHDDVLLQTAQVVDGALDRGFREHAGSLLERCRRDERIGRERRFGNAEQQRPAGRRLAAVRNRLLVLFAEAELVDLLLQQERRVAHVFHLHPTHHLTDDHLDVLVADVHTLQPIDFLDFVHQVSLQLLFPQHGENVMRVEWSVHQRLAGANTLTFLHVDVNTTRHLVFLLGTVVSHHVDLALSLGHVAELNHAVDLADNRGFTRFAGFEQFHHARQTARDVLGLGGFARDLRQHVARSDRVAVLYHQVSSRRHQVTFAGLASLDDDCRLTLFVRRIDNHVAREASHFVHLFVQRHSFLQVLELHCAANLGEDGKGVRIPLDQHISQRDLLTVFDLDLGTVDNRIAFLFTSLVVNDRDGTIAVHHHQMPFLGPDGHKVDEAHRAIVLGIQARLLADSRRRTTDMERAHGQLRSWLADGLRCDDARRLTELDQSAGSQVAAVTHHADTALRLASEHRTNLDPLDTRRLHRTCQVLGDLLVDVNDDVAFVILDLLQRDPTDNTVTQRLDDFSRLDDRGHVNAVHRAAIVFADDHILCHIYQTAGEIARIRRLEGSISQAFASAVSRNEILQHRQTFTEVCRDWRLDDFARRLGHQSAHARKLTNLLLRTTSAGVGHNVNRVDFAGLVHLLHVAEHLVGHLFGNCRPDFDHLVVALTVGDRAVQILLLHSNDLLLGIAHQRLLARWYDHVVDADGQACPGCILETELLNTVQHPNRSFQPKAQVAVIHQLTDALLLQQAIDVWHVRRAALQVVIHNGATYRSRDELALKVCRLSVDHVLVVIRGRQVNHFTRVTQPNRSERLHFARFLGEQDFVDIGKRAPLALGAGLGFRKVVNAEHHVLRGYGDWLARRRRQNVVRCQHQNAGFHLRFRRQRNVHRHLVAIEVCVECRTDQGVDLDRFALHQYRLKGLYAQTVQRRSSVQQNGMVLDDLFQDVPNDGLLRLYHFLCLLDGCAMSGLLQTVVNEGLEQLERHLLG